MFGPHLIIDGTRCDTRKLGDRILVEQVLNDYPNAIGMTKIGGPYMFEYQAPDPAYSGVSGLVVIAESHIAIHTFPELDYFTMDIFSCKNFDHETAIEYIRKAFDVKEMDRMLVQRGLSFRGPHHGALGATDELIAAAEARLAAGIVSKETAEPGAGYTTPELASEREAALLRRAEPQAETSGSAGRMLWPQYGVTPDVGSYGEAASPHLGATPLTHNLATPETTDGQPLRAGEATQVNPTASISGLLDKLCATAGPARALGQSLATWELAGRDPDATIAMALSTPLVAAGMRELLVYAIEHRYVDVVVASADDLAADLYEALGQVHFASNEGPVATDAGRERVADFLATFVAALDATAITSGADFLRVLGETLRTSAPRKGLLQAAAASGVMVVAPDLSTSVFGAAVMTAQEQGVSLPLDGAADLVALTRRMSTRPRLSIVRAGAGSADALLRRSRDIASALGMTSPTLTSSVSLGTSASLAAGDHHVATAMEPAIALPLLVTGLAQRIPSARPMLTEPVTERDSTAEPALA